MLHLTVGTAIEWFLIGLVVIGLVFAAVVRLLAVIWFAKAIASEAADAHSPSSPTARPILKAVEPVRRHTAS
jgi:hypothetical protein